MKNKLLLLFSLFLLAGTAIGQTQKKYYYDNEWKGTSASKAEFYRIVNFDQQNKPVGEVRDYFITGELQSIIDGALLIDRDDDSESIFIGNSRGFLKNGKKQFESLYDRKGNMLSHKTWFENGNLQMEAAYKNGEYHGDYILYYESGKVYRIFSFSNGEMNGKFFTECDEFEDCQKVFYESFYSAENDNGWNLISDEKEFKSNIIPTTGLKMKSSGPTFQQTVNVPLSLSEDFSIETIVDLKSGETNTGQGLIWGFRNWDNYYYFTITATGYYIIGGKTEGINLEFADWTESDKINKDYQRNLLKILKVGDKVYYSINGSVVFSGDFYSFRGNNIGFLISGSKDVLFENLIVKQDVSSDPVSNRSVSTGTGWKGNGTGFFISRDGYLATNYHVIDGASEIEIEFIRNGQKIQHQARVIQSDKQNDLAILKIKDDSFTPFNDLPYFFETELSDIGTNVFALGYPMALSVMGTEIKFTDGKISSKTGFQGDISTYQMTTPIQPGNSGGPLFDFDGRLIGINSAIIRPDLADNVSYAIKSSYLKNLIDVLPASLQLPNDLNIRTKTLTEKIKIISDFVVLIKTK
ncbi:trypsin-like peptidase domain-containing protein [Salinimicrobium flavum]|uniref:Trypsin-like peptidase domain-containing protein n=1 Tax=Salinimicrobium flavum TaxID=1737065 RepID=A0ABW5IZR6_9FLAO